MALYPIVFGLIAVLALTSGLACLIYQFKKHKHNTGILSSLSVLFSVVFSCVPVADVMCIVLYVADTYRTVLPVEGFITLTIDKEEQSLVQQNNAAYKTYSVDTYVSIHRPL